MEYRLVNKNGYKLSSLSYGCMRLTDADSASAAIRKAIELGVNYFDVAPAYCKTNSERWLGEGIKGLRDKIILTAKSSTGDGGEGLGAHSPETGFGIRTSDQARAQVERSMKILGVDHLDAYHLWAVHSNDIFDEAMRPGGFMDGVVKSHAEGLFDHIGITTHLDSESIIRCLKAFDFSLVTLPFYIGDTSRHAAVQYCDDHGIGVIAMNPLAGGRLAKPSPVLHTIAADLGCKSMAEAALRFLIGYPGITAALNGLTYEDQVVDSVESVSRGPLSAEDSSTLDSRLSELYTNVKHFCTACGYCGECTKGILIPKVLEIYTKMLVPSISETVRRECLDLMAADSTGYDPSHCVACGVCESKCPNNLPISELMAAAAQIW